MAVGASVERSLTIRLLLASDQFDEAMLRKGISIKVLAAELEKTGKDSGGKAGTGFVGAFETAVRSKLDAALKALPSARIGIDSADADARISKVRGELLDLSGKTIGVDIDVHTAEARLAALKAELSALTGKDQTIQVRTDSKAALTAVNDLEKLLAGAALEGKKSASALAKVEEKLAGTSPLVYLVAAGVTLLGPATAAATAGLFETAGAAGVAFLAYKGIRQEMTDGTPVGLQFKAALSGISGEWQHWEAVAAGAAGPGALGALQQLRAFMPTLEPYIARLGAHLGAALSTGTGGLVSGLHVLAPLLDDAGVEAEHFADGFARFMQSDQFRQFIAYARQELPIVARDVADLTKLAVDLGVALQPVGDGLLNRVDEINRGLDKMMGPLAAVTRLASSGKGVGGSSSELSPSRLLDDLTNPVGHVLSLFGGHKSKAATPDATDVETSYERNAKSLAQLATQYRLTTTQAQGYLALVGISPAELNDESVAQSRIADALAVTTAAYGDASQSQSAYLQAVATFAGSAGTAADRAALIGATLKAGNGDALNYAGAMVVAATANQRFVTDFDQARTEAHKAHLAFDDARTGVVDLTTGTINYRNAAAGPLISDLQSMQDAAMKAAQATYQHGAATDKAKAATDAYNQYVAQTHDALVAEATQLGVTKDQAGKLADKYFGMPKDVKTQIQAIGTDPVVQILDRIGAMLARLTGQPWVSQVDADTSQARAALGGLGVALDEITKPRTIPVKVIGPGATTAGSSSGLPMIAHLGGTAQAPASGAGRPPANASGGGVADGWFTAGEQGWELGYKSGSTVRFFSHPQSAQMLPQGPAVPAYAGGTEGAFVGVVAPSPSKVGPKYGPGHLSPAAAAALHNQVVAIQFKVDNTDLDRLLSATRGTAAQIRTAMASLIGDVHNAALKGLGSESVIPQLRRGALELESYANRKAAVVAKLKAANGQLGAAEKLWAEQQKSTAAAVMGTFDAGTSGNGTYGSLMGVLGQKIGQAQRFATDVKSLTGRLNKSALAQIESEGPDQAGANLHALAGASPAQLAAYNAKYTQLQALAQQVGVNSADSLYKAGVDAAKGLVRGLESQQAAISKAMSKIAASLVAQIKHDLKISSPSRVAHELFAHVGGGAVTGLLSQEASVGAAGSRLAHAAVVSPGQLAFARPVPHSSAAAQGIDYARLGRSVAEAMQSIPVTGELRGDGAGLSVSVSKRSSRGVQ